MLDKIKKFRQRLIQGPPVCGPILDFDGWQMLRGLRQCRYFDFVWIDLEHGAVTLDGAYKAVDTLAPTHLLPIVRASAADPTNLKKIADLGCGGIVLPHIESAEVARQALDSCLYPPAGSRSIGPNLAANQWMIPGKDYVRLCNDNLFLAVQIESARGVENISSICAIDRVDLIFIGRFDLSASLGHPMEVEHPAVREAEQTVLAAARLKGKAVGTIAGQKELFQKTVRAGYNFILTTSLMNIVSSGIDAFFDGLSGNTGRVP